MVLMNGFGGIVRNARRAIVAGVALASLTLVGVGGYAIGHSGQSVPSARDAQYARHIESALSEVATTSPWYTSVDDGGNVVDHYRDEVQVRTPWGGDRYVEIPIAKGFASVSVASRYGEVMSDPVDNSMWVEVNLGN